MREREREREREIQSGKEGSKKVAQDSKCKVYDELYNKLGGMERENNIYKHVKMRKMKARDFNGV